MFHLSPSNLVAYEQLGRPDSPWMTAAKFKSQFLGLDTFSEKADAGNAVHEASLDGQTRCLVCSVVPNPNWPRCEACGSTGVTIRCPDCNATGRRQDTIKGDYQCPDCLGRGWRGPDWFVQPELIEAIRSHLRADDGVAEAAHVLDGKDFGITEFNCRLSMRFDYLTTTPRILHELKTTGELHIERYAKSAQVLAYLVALRIPVVVIGAEIKIKKRGRLGKRGDVTLVHHEERVCEPKPDDADRLKALFLRCARYIMDDEEMKDRALNRTDPELL